MKQPQKKESCLESNDIDGWRLAVKEHHLSNFPLEAIVCAIQDLGVSSDDELINALALFLSNRVMQILRRKVNKSYPNEGLEIIEAAHHQIIEAILSPQTADGKALRVAFMPRLNFRLADVFKAEKAGRDALNAFKEKESTDLTEDNRIDPRLPSVAESAYVEEVLSRIADDRKRLAFRLHMEKVPVKSKKSMSISKALEKSDKTIESWIEEIQKQLKSIVEE